MNSITSFTSSDIVSLHQGQPVTTSLKVAEVFGKRHSHVLRTIESLECHCEFTSAHFWAHEEIIQAGAVKRASKYYEMTKDGFMLLVMGFTGKPAMATKIAFINAFNWMADQLAVAQRPLGITLPAANGADGTYCGRLLVNVEYSQITGCRPLPDGAFIATAATLGDHLKTPGNFSLNELREIADISLTRFTELANGIAQVNHTRLNRSSRRYALGN